MAKEFFQQHVLVAITIYAPISATSATQKETPIITKITMTMRKPITLFTIVTEVISSSACLYPSIPYHSLGPSQPSVI
jgi:hypothetical protein